MDRKSDMEKYQMVLGTVKEKDQGEEGVAG